MEIIRIPFSENPARFTAGLIQKHGFGPEDTLLVTPSHRFKSYAASFFLELHRGEGLISPSMLTAGELTQEIITSTAKQIAGYAEKLSLLFSACKNTPGITEVFPAQFMDDFVSFRSTAQLLFNSFDQLNTGEVGPDRISCLADEYAPYRQFGRHLEILRTLYENYFQQQKRAGVFDLRFLMREITEEHINNYFSPYREVVLVSP
ncbi:MAG: hypothetical protein ACOC7U_09800, partial [Spirochaetota bacterium]